MATLDITVVVKLERKEKHLGRIETSLLQSDTHTIPDFIKVVEDWMEQTRRSIPFYNPERFHIEAKGGGFDYSRIQKGGTISNTRHVRAVYDNRDCWNPPTEEEEAELLTAHEENPNLINVVAVSPYTKEIAGTLYVGHSVTIGELCHKLSANYYDENLHSKKGNPENIIALLPFGRPDPNYDAPEANETYTEQEVINIIERVRRDTLNGALNEALEGETNSDLPTGAIASSLSEVPSTPGVQGGDFSAFSGVGQRLGADIKIEEVKPTPVVEDEPVGADKWETDTQPIPLNQQSAEMPHQYYVSIEGKVIYTFFANRTTRFGALIDELQGVGCDIGAPNETNQFLLKFNKSTACRHENLQDWGGDGTTYCVVPKVPLAGGGYVKGTIGKNKSSPHQSPKPSKNKMIDEKKAVVADCNASLQDVVFQTDRIADITAEAGKKMKQVFDMCENGSAKSALKQMISSLDEAGFEQLVAYPSGRPEDRARHVANVLLSYYIPKVTQASFDLEAVTASSQAVVELMLSHTLLRDVGTMDWSILPRLIENEQDLRARSGASI